MTARGTWKAAERRIADDLKGKRIPVTGIDRDGADVVTPLFLVQSKLRKTLPVWLWTWLMPIACDAREQGRIGILVLRKPKMRNNDGLIVLRYDDFVSLVGALTPPEDGE
jgi:hypothetical protein